MAGSGIPCLRRGVEVVDMRFLVGVGHVSAGLTSVARVHIRQPGVAFRAGVGEHIEATLHGPTVISKVGMVCVTRGQTRELLHKMKGLVFLELC